MWRGKLLLCILLTMVVEKNSKDNKKTTSLKYETHSSKLSRFEKQIYFYINHSKEIYLGNINQSRHGNQTKWTLNTLTYFYKNQKKMSNTSLVAVSNQTATNNTAIQVLKEPSYLNDSDYDLENNMNSSIQLSKVTTETLLETTSKNTLNPTDISENSTAMPRLEDLRYPEICLNIEPSSTRCPENFKYLPNIFENDQLCYQIIKDDTFPPVCPYENNLPYYNVSFIIKLLFYTEKIWLNAYKDEVTGFGYFEWMDTEIYGSPIKDITLELDFHSSNNCLIVHKDQFIPVRCTDRYSTLCVYSWNKIQSSSLLKQCQKNHGLSCMLSHYDFAQANCLCEKNSALYQPKTDFCEKPAELIFPFQTEFLLKNYENVMAQKSCWIGLHKEPSSSGLYKWFSTYEDVTYTHWSYIADCANTEGAIRFNTPAGWILEPDNTLRCAICEYPFIFEEPVLGIQYSQSGNWLELVILFASTVVSYNGKVEVHCFSDNNVADFKYKLDPIDIKAEWSEVIIAVIPLSNDPSHYWCEAFTYPYQTIIKSNAIVAYNKLYGYGHEFVFYVEVSVSEGMDPFLRNEHVQTALFIENYINSKTTGFIQTVRPMRGFILKSEMKVYLILHLTTRKMMLSAKDQYETLLEIFNKFNNNKFRITDILSSEVCFSGTTLSENSQVLEWPQTDVGVTTVPSNALCLDATNNLTPVTRTCMGTFLLGAQWLEPIGICSTENAQYSEITKDLFNLSNSLASPDKITEILKNITLISENALPIDLHLISKVMENLAKTKTNLEISPVINNLFKFNPRVLKDSQIGLNSTDRILAYLDEMLSQKNPGLIKTDNFITQIFDLRNSNVSGLFLKSQIFFQKADVVLLYSNSSFEAVLNDVTVDSVVFFLPETIAEIKESFPDEEPIKVIVTIFFKDVLFNEVDKLDQQSVTKIIGVTIPKFNKNLKYPIKIGYKLLQNYTNRKNCSHWSYGQDDMMLNIYGKWKTNRPSQERANLIHVCEFFHMTHFGLMLQGDLILNVVPTNDKVLEIISLVGSTFSLFGIVPIFLTAIFFRNWRNRSGNIILLNFCSIITFQIIVISVLHLVREDGVSCVILGAFFHYALLSEFIWMLIIAQLQYRRFVLVLHPHQDNIVKKCLIVGWGVPLFPIVLTLSISPDNYGINPYGFCSVLGNYSLYGMILPLIIVLIANALYFVKIIYSVFRQNMITSAANKNRNIKLELLLVVFLFFTLGLNWVFCIIGAIWNWTVFTLIFFFTSALRGLVLFLYFIVGNKETRLMWKKQSNYYVNKKLEKKGSTRSSNKLIWYSEQSEN